MTRNMKFSRWNTPLPQREDSEPDLWERLTPREKQLARMTAQGMTIKEISERLGIRYGTVATYLQEVYGRLGIAGGHAQLRLCAWMWKHGLCE